MITVQTFFTETLNTVDAVIGNFVQTAYTHWVQANMGLITLAFTLYVMLLGYQFIFHTQAFTLSTVTRHLVVMLGVYGMVMNWPLYHLFVYRVFTTEPARLAAIMVEAGGTLSAGASVGEALNGIYAAVCHASAVLLAQTSFSISGLAFIGYAFLVLVIGFLLCVFALLLFVYAKMMMAIALALGPVFLLFLLWEPTKGLFGAWLRKLLTIALIPVVTTAMLVLMLSVIHVTLPGLTQPADKLQFYGIAPFLGLSLTTTLMLAQVLNICGSLGGGLTLMGLSAGAAIARSSLHYSTLPVRGAVNWLRDRRQRRLNRPRGRS